MKFFKRIFLTFTVITAVVFFSGCPAVLTPDLPSDIVISLGLIRAAEGNTELRSAVGGEIYVPVLINDLNNPTVSGSYEVTFTLSTDADLSTTGDNIAAGNETITAGTETVITLTVPAAAVAGTYNLFASFEAAAADPALKVGETRLNLSYVQVVIGAANEADLELVFVNPPAEYRAPGATFPISFKITNAGSKKLASGTDVVVRFEIPISGTPTEFGEATVTLASDLYPYDFVTGTAEISMPTLTQIAADLVVAEGDVESWTGTLTGTVDPDDSIVEIVEGGTDTFGVESGTAKPDLTVSAVDLPATAVVVGDVEVAVEVSNSGYAQAAAGSYGLTLFFDADGDGTYNTGDVDIHAWAAADTPAVPWGKEVLFFSTSVEDLVYPAAITAGANRQIGAVITGDLDEWDSTNNTSTAGIDFIEKDVDLAFDYISSSLTSVIDEAAGGTVPVSLIIKNNGSESVTTDFSVTFYASSNSGLTPAGDIDLGAKSVTADIAPGKTVISFDAIFPASEGAGFYTVYADIDSGDAVTESDETNNSPSSYTESPVFVVVDDGATTLSATMLVCLPDKADNNGYYQQFSRFYDALWTTSSTDNSWLYYDSGPDVLITDGIDITPGQTHGARFYTANEYTTPDYNAYCWRIVPTYVTDIDDKYIPSVLTGRDQFEENDSEDSAAELAGSTHPFYSWVSSYDTDNSDNDYYTFDF